TPLCPPSPRCPPGAIAGRRGWRCPPAAGCRGTHPAAADGNDCRPAPDAGGGRGRGRAGQAREVPDGGETPGVNGSPATAPGGLARCGGEWGRRGFRCRGRECLEPWGDHTERAGKRQKRRFVEGLFILCPTRQSATTSPGPLPFHPR